METERRQARRDRPATPLAFTDLAAPLTGERKQWKNRSTLAQPTYSPPRTVSLMRGPISPQHAQRGRQPNRYPGLVRRKLRVKARSKPHRWKPRKVSGTSYCDFSASRKADHADLGLVFNRGHCRYRRGPLLLLFRHVQAAIRQCSNRPGSGERIGDAIRELDVNFLSSIFSGIGSAAFGDAINTAENYTLAAFSIIAGELLIIILLIAAIMFWGVAIG